MNSHFTNHSFMISHTASPSIPSCPVNSSSPVPDILVASTNIISPPIAVHASPSATCTYHYYSSHIIIVAYLLPLQALIAFLTHHGQIGLAINYLKYLIKVQKCSLVLGTSHLPFKRGKELLWQFQEMCICIWLLYANSKNLTPKISSSAIWSTTIGRLAALEAI